MAAWYRACVSDLFFWDFGFRASDFVLRISDFFFGISTKGLLVVEESSRQPAPEDPRVRLAGERTLLAWVRTGLAMMGFGFVVARFGLFLQEIAAAGQKPVPPSTGLSLWIGTALVLLGVTVNGLAAAEHVRFLRRLDRGEAYHAPRWSLGVIVAVVLAALGVGMTVYLLLLAG